MNQQIIENLCQELNILKSQAEVVLTLLQEGNTIPFIARYRKEATKGLDEEQIRSIHEVYIYQENLWKRKEDVIRLIDEKGLLTEELKQSILACQKLVEVEDMYRPFKEKKKTKATDAIAKGLEPLAKKVMSFPIEGTLETLAKPYLNEQVKTTLEAYQGAMYIIAEWISDNASYRKYLRRTIYYDGVIVTKKKKGAEDIKLTYEMYYDYQEKINHVKPHRILAINRGENEGVLSVNLDYSFDGVFSYIKDKVIKNPKSYVIEVVENAIKDSLKRLILPSVEREIRATLKEMGEVSAIENFSKNVEKLLLTPPMTEVCVLGFDPAYRTGCKLAVLDKTGKPLEIAVIYPHAPQLEVEQAKQVVLDLIHKYHIDMIAIGNGTASRESEQFIADVIKEAKHKVEYLLVSEAGASVYSASKLAISEFPTLTVEKRSAISIGRRVQDALAELVKIDPKSIGVGLYQHDVPSKKLDESLEFVVTKAVNQVGVNINNASFSLLSYVSGLNKKVIDNIISTRDEQGKFTSRNALKKIKGMTDKIYQQSIGFLRILDGENPLDKTPIHPEQYNAVEKLLEKIGLTTKSLGSEELITKLDDLDKKALQQELAIDAYTLDDIILSLKKPLRDPRDEMMKPLLRQDILHIEDLHIGDELQGTVRNVVDFGLFIDVGLKNDGLAHISQLTNQYIKHPKELFNVGDIVTCYVIDISLEKQKISLSLRKNAN